MVASESRKYMNEFLKTKCSTILLENELFPDAKELSESFGAFHRVPSKSSRIWYLTTKVFHLSR